MSGVGITYLWLSKEFPTFVRLEGKRGDYEVYTPERTCGMREESEYVECKVQTFTCSMCGWHGAIDDLFASDTQPNFCPNCGAKAVGE